MCVGDSAPCRPPGGGVKVGRQLKPPCPVDIMGIHPSKIAAYAGPVRQHALLSWLGSIGAQQTELLDMTKSCSKERFVGKRPGPILNEKPQVKDGRE